MGGPSAEFSCSLLAVPAVSFGSYEDSKAKLETHLDLHLAAPAAAVDDRILHDFMHILLP